MNDRPKFKIKFQIDNNIEIFDVESIDFVTQQVFFKREDGNLYNIGLGVKDTELIVEQLETSQARIKELENFIEGLKRNLKEENLTYVSDIDINKEAFKDLTKQILMPKYTLLYKGKALKEWEQENNRLRGWREIAHKKINELSQRVKNYIKCTNALTCEINDLKEENQNLKEQIKELQYQIEHNKRIRDFGNKQMVKKIKENKLLKQKLEIAEEALNDIESQNVSCWCKFCKDRIVKTLQKMKGTEND